MDAAAAQPGFGGVLFSFRGWIDRGRYWLGLLAATGIFVLCSALASTAMNSTGSNVAFLAIPMLLLFLWVYAAVTVKRLRDMGWPFWTQIVYPLLFPVWYVGVLEYVEVITVIYGIVALPLLVLPGALKSTGIRSGQPA